MLKLALISLIKDKEHSPINLAYLATYMKKHLKNNIDIKIIDSNFDNIPLNLSIYKPDIIGISAITLHYKTAKRLATLIKKYLKIPIILGGVHISTCPESLTKDFDVAVVGEGEKILLKLIKLYQKTKSFQDLKKIPNLVFYENDQITQTEKSPQVENIDEFPIPDRNFLNPRYFLPKKFQDLSSNKNITRTELITSRGCPYKCIFCSTSYFWETVRFHSPERVVKEMVYLNKIFNVNHFQISDDLFAFDKKRLLKIKKLMKKNNLLGNVSLYCQIRGNLVDEELLTILKSMNVISVNIGLESGSNKILQTLKGKNITVEQIKNAVILCKKYDLDIHGSFMMASPGETEEDMKKTIDLMKQLKEIGINECWCGVTTPLPKTKLWGLAKISKDINWDTLNPGLPFNPYFLDFSIKKFIKLFKEAKNLSIEIAKQNSNYKENKLKRYIKNLIFFNKYANKLVFKTRRKRFYKKLDQDFKKVFSFNNKAIKDYSCRLAL